MTPLIKFFLRNAANTTKMPADYYLNTLYPLQDNVLNVMTTVDNNFSQFLMDFEKRSLNGRSDRFIRKILKNNNFTCINRANTVMLNFDLFISCVKLGTVKSSFA